MPQRTSSCRDSVRAAGLTGPRITLGNFMFQPAHLFRLEGLGAAAQWAGLVLDLRNGRRP